MQKKEPSGSFFCSSRNCDKRDFDFHGEVVVSVLSSQSFPWHAEILPHLPASELTVPEAGIEEKIFSVSVHTAAVSIAPQSRAQLRIKLRFEYPRVDA